MPNFEELFDNAGQKISKKYAVWLYFTIVDFKYGQLPLSTEIINHRIFSLVKGISTDT